MGLYWANTSSNSLVGKLIRQGNPQTKVIMEDLLKGGTLEAEIDEEIVFNQLTKKHGAVWSLLLASGYPKVEGSSFSMPYNEFIQALLLGDVKAMNRYMNKVALVTFSYFDVGKRPSNDAEPERFPSVKATTMGLTEPNPSVG